MAALMKFTCKKCGFSVDCWGDGDTYIQAPDGTRHFFHHPCEDEQIKDIVRGIVGHPPTQDEIDDQLKNHSGNQWRFICKDCLVTTGLDEDKDVMVCGKCGSKRLIDRGNVAGKTCFVCKKGRFDKGRMTGVS